MKNLLLLIVSILIVQESVAPPVDKKNKKDEKGNEVQEELQEVMEYHRYLQEVVQTLESDSDFRAKLEKTDESDIRSGRIADELEFVNHKVRTKLDELKRYELERLRRLAVEEYKLEHGLDSRHMKISEHIDHSNPHTFEIVDLKKLIAKTTKDLDEADKRRREEFKQYEMNKKFEQEEKMKNMTEEEKKTFENEIHDLEKKHKEHEPLHHPGSKKQLEEVWEKQDHMENQEFDPKTFFYMHDLDGNGVWDPNEVKALFLKELDKLYAEGHPEDDLVERAEELERMREHVIREADLNRDGLISYEEFINESKKKEFEEDPGWEPLDQQQIYSEQEYEEYRKLKAKEIERTIAKGMSQQYPAGHLQVGHEQFPPHPNQVPQDYMHQQAQYPHQVPPQNYPPQGQYMNQVPPQHGQYNQIPQHPGQYGNQVPQQAGQFGNQMPPAAGQFGNQIPQYQQQQQYYPNQQVPVPHQGNQVPQHHVPPVNQQVPIGQNQVPPPQQYHHQQQQHQQQQQLHQQQPPQQLHANQVPQQAPQANQQQVPVQQYQQQQAQANQVPVQVNQQQVPVVQNQIPQQVPQQAQPGNPASNAIHQNQPNHDQQVPVASQNQYNTQNQVPQQTHEQIASMNNGQEHQNAPHSAKT